MKALLNKMFFLIFNKNYRFWVLARRGFYNYLDDKRYLCRMYEARFGKKLNIDYPVTFNEKIQWMKLNVRKEEFVDMVDKYNAKIYVDRVLGEGYTIPTIGVWDTVDEINFSSLPNQFVLKCTHDSGGLSICKNKKDFDIEAAKKKLKCSLKKDFSSIYREWVYKNVQPRIIAETYIESNSSEGLVDYKFFCFNGEPLFLYVSRGLDNHATAGISFFDLEGKRLPFKRKDYDGFDEDLILPGNFEEMKQIAKKLCKEIQSPFVRIDLYSVENKTLFSEITFYPNAGYIPFEPEEWDYVLGEKLKLQVVD